VRLGGGGGLWAINCPPSYLLPPRCIIKSTYTFKVPNKGEKCVNAKIIELKD